MSDDRFISRLEGRSMWPTLHPGDWVRFAPGAPPRPGEIWVARLAPGLVCHRVWARRADGAVLFWGDFRLGPDGWVDAARLQGRVTQTCHQGRWRPENRRRDRLRGLAWSAAATGYLATRRLLGAAFRAARQAVPARQG